MLRRLNDLQLTNEEVKEMKAGRTEDLDECAVESLTSRAVNTIN